MKKPFRVLDLVLIICIIGACLTLVVPLIADMGNVYTAKCAANGRQIVAALLQYMSDYDGRFPSSASSQQIAEATSKFGMSNYNWYGYQMNKDVGMAQWRYIQLRSYIKDDSIWVCPNPVSLYSQRYAYGWRISWLLRSSDSFVDGDRGFHDSQGTGLTIEEVELLDLDWQNYCGPRYMPRNKKIIAWCYCLGEWANASLGSPPGTFPWRFPSYNHQEGSNFAYADGHVEWKAMGKGWAPIGYTWLDVDNSPSGNYTVATGASLKAAAVEARTTEDFESKIQALDDLVLPKQR